MFNPSGAKETDEIVLTESVIDALALWSIGVRNVMCSYGVNALTDEILEHLRESRVRRVVLMLGNGDFINIKDYELTLENGFPLKEIYRTRDGDLSKTYSYKGGKLIGVVYLFTDLQNKSNSLEKRFEYHMLNQKP